MNSSISVSERWRRLIALYAASALALGAAVATLLLALDPYDTGRLALLGEHGVPRLGQRLAAASLGRRPNVDTAIIGNSVMQLLHPARIDAAGGGRVVQLTIPGTGPPEQIVVAEWFRRHHPGANLRGLTIGLDQTWCRGDGRLELTNPFPYWLYGDSALDYAAGLMSLKSIEAVVREVKLLLGRAPPARDDGYVDYEVGRVWTAEGVAARTAPPADIDTPAAPAGPPPDFAAVPLLHEFLRRLPAAARVVLVFPPRHRHAIARPGSAAAAMARACLAAFAALAAERPGTLVLDFVGRDGMTEDGDFWDLIHYRATVARRMETEIAAALGGPRTEKEDLQ
jgi:hypothetical protein